ncbi:MAG: nucleotide sugar dehydrogenase [Gammaproteobacteria bacterium]
MMHNRKISVIGLGYVGLPVAVTFGQKDQVIGLDVSERRITELKQGNDLTNEVSPQDLASARIKYTSDPDDLREADFHIITVPTPINAAKHPDLTLLMRATEVVGSRLKQGDIVVYESTVYPGATEDECVPVLEQASGLVCGSDFFVGYSPERINPGDRQHTFTTIHKVVSAQNEEVLNIVADVYGSVVKAGIHRASSIKVAEAAKVIENTQRDLNIALMNELSLIFDKLDIDTLDVLEAAGTKWNFLPFTPGLVGGHCIGIDPYYLTHKAEMTGYHPQVILAGRNINDGMGKYIAAQIVKALIHIGNGVKGSRATIFGLTFKENVPDLRNTRIVDIVRELESYGVIVQVHDPLADNREALSEYGIELTEYDMLEPADAAILAVPHGQYVENGWSFIQQKLNNGETLVYDVKGILPRDKTPDQVTLLRL